MRSSAARPLGRMLTRTGPVRVAAAVSLLATCLGAAAAPAGHGERAPDRAALPHTPVQGPQPPASGVMGNGNGLAVVAPGTNTLTAATGSFPILGSVTSASGPVGNPSGPSVPEAYSLQLNTNLFQVQACPVSPPPPTIGCCPTASVNCRGWQQFLFEHNPSNVTTPGKLYIQYWLLKYGTPSDTCPADWVRHVPVTDQSVLHCRRDSALPVPVGASSPSTQLNQLRLTAKLAAGVDSVELSIGAASPIPAEGNNFLGLADPGAARWTHAQFNVYGLGGNENGGSQLNFNAGAWLNVRTELTYQAGSANPNERPLCQETSYSAETNNRYFNNMPGSVIGTPPAIVFKQGDATMPLQPTSCAQATSTGDTHLSTFAGLFYDMQAGGDFVLVQADSDFVVQTRQIPSAPRWPDASVNSAVAARMGKTQVAICLPKAGSDGPVMLFVDRKARELREGASLLHDGVRIWREGSIYLVKSVSGHSVRAEVNPGWINVRVGLGRWPAKVRGLLANANDNVELLETRDGSVLRSPLSFNDLYRRHAESWRVGKGESLLSACAGSDERSIPERPLYAGDLDAKVREGARATCTKAGAMEGPLLDACTLDVAVLGIDDASSAAAARAFVGAAAPLAVATFVVAPERGLTLPLWVWLLLVAAATIALWIVAFRK